MSGDSAFADTLPNMETELLLVQNESSRPGLSPRDSVEVDVRYRLVGEDRWFLAQAANMSDTGILFHCNRNLKTGAEVEMYLVQTDAYGNELAPVTTGRGHVVRSQRNNGKKLSSVSIAVQFCK